MTTLYFVYAVGAINILLFLLVLTILIRTLTGKKQIRTLEDLKRSNLVNYGVNSVRKSNSFLEDSFLTNMADDTLDSSQEEGSDKWKPKESSHDNTKHAYSSRDSAYRIEISRDEDALNSEQGGNSSLDTLPRGPSRGGKGSTQERIAASKKG